MEVVQCVITVSFWLMVIAGGTLLTLIIALCFCAFVVWFTDMLGYNEEEKTPAEKHDDRFPDGVM